MLQCVYVKLRNVTDNFWEPDKDLTEVIVVKSKSRSWRFASAHYTKSLHERRLQISLLPRKQVALHGVQGCTTDPGLVVYWRFSKKLSKETLWLAHMIRSRSRRLADLLNHELSDRATLQKGPSCSATPYNDSLLRRSWTSIWHVRRLGGSWTVRKGDLLLNDLVVGRLRWGCRSWAASKISPLGEGSISIHQEELGTRSEKKTTLRIRSFKQSKRKTNLKKTTSTQYTHILDSIIQSITFSAKLLLPFINFTAHLK